MKSKKCAQNKNGKVKMYICRQTKHKSTNSEVNGNKTAKHYISFYDIQLS